MSSNKTLIIGSSGMVGSELTKNLRKLGVDVRETTSRKDHVSTGAHERVYVNVATGEGIHQAFDGVEQAFILSPPGYADQYTTLSPLIQEAKRRILKKVVLMTAMGANASDETPFRRAELELERSGLNWNIIRPNWFMQNFHTFWGEGIRTSNLIALPAGTAQTSFVDARDISDVATILLTSNKFDRQAFDLTGPTALSHEEVAELLRKHLRRSIAYEDINPEVLRNGLEAAGLPKDYVAFMILIFGFLREGYNARVTDSVSRITGCQPRSFISYVNDHRNLLA